MKVILLQNIKGLGNRYDVKNVKDGYARNFLFPKGFAKIATNKEVKELETQKAVQQKEKQEAKNQLELLAKKLAEQEFRFTIKTGEKGEVFGSISKEDIKKAVSTSISLPVGDLPKGYNDIEVNLEKPIKKLGEHQVEINLGGPARHASRAKNAEAGRQGEAGGGIKTNIKVNVAAL